MTPRIAVPQKKTTAKPPKKTKRQTQTQTQTRRKPAKPTMASKADRHALYQGSVQVPEADIEIFDSIFRKIRGRRPMSMREDFCGTAFLSCTWVASHPKRTAIGVDLDRPTLDWGEAHNVAKLTAAQRKRLELIQADVLDGRGSKCELTCALNFSYSVFKTREMLCRYFEAARERLTDDGVFITELYGGTEAIIELTEERRCKNFVYVWEQARFNPITHETLCHIHFKFADKSRIDRAFTYDWRLWTLPELRELLLEAGFRKVEVWWESVDEDGEGTGEYHPTEYEENQESWLTYVVAHR
jgi:hypothetical protein